MATTALISYGAARTPAVSDAAVYVSAQIETGRNRLQSSVYFGLAGKGIFNDLFAMAEECKSPNWDSQGARPISDETYRVAYHFLEALPLGIVAPTVGAEPDGQLTLEWHRSPRRTLSLSVSPEGELHYAALLGPSKAYGTEPFFGEVPRVILDLVADVMNP